MTTIRTLGATPVRGELGSIAPEAIAGSEAVIHCAAFVKQWGTREQFWERQRRRDTSTAAGSAPGRCAAASSISAPKLRCFMASTCATSTSAIRTRRTRRSCIRRRKRLRRSWCSPRTHRDFTTLSIRPRFVWGPGDQTILPVLEAMVRSGRFVWIDGGRARTSTTHIANLVRGGRAGARARHRRQRLFRRRRRRDSDARVPDGTARDAPGHAAGQVDSRLARAALGAAKQLASAGKLRIRR